MQQTPAEPALRRARSDLIKAARARQGLSQELAVRFINVRLAGMGQPPITRAHLANIEVGRCGLKPTLSQAIAAALAISEAELRTPLIAIQDAA